MVTDSQVRRLFAMKNKVKYLYQLADKAGMSAKTARKYLRACVKSGRNAVFCRYRMIWNERHIQAI